MGCERGAAAYQCAHAQSAQGPATAEHSIRRMPDSHAAGPPAVESKAGCGCTRSHQRTGTSIRCRADTHRSLRARGCPGAAHSDLADTPRDLLRIEMLE